MNLRIKYELKAVGIRVPIILIAIIIWGLIAIFFKEDYEYVLYTQSIIPYTLSFLTCFFIEELFGEHTNKLLFQIKNNIFSLLYSRFILLSFLFSVTWFLSFSITTLFSNFELNYQVYLIVLIQAFMMEYFAVVLMLLLQNMFYVLAIQFVFRTSMKIVFSHSLYLFTTLSIDQIQRVSLPIYFAEATIIFILSYIVTRILVNKVP